MDAACCLCPMDLQSVARFVLACKRKGNATKNMHSPSQLYFYEWFPFVLTPNSHSLFNEVGRLWNQVFEWHVRHFIKWKIHRHCRHRHQLLMESRWIFPSSRSSQLPWRSIYPRDCCWRWLVRRRWRTRAQWSGEPRTRVPGAAPRGAVPPTSAPSGAPSRAISYPSWPSSPSLGASSSDFSSGFPHQQGKTMSIITYNKRTLHF